VQFATPEHLLAEPADDFVESFLGYDRGFRRLSFFEGKALSLREPKTVIRGATTGVGGVPESGSTADAGPATSSTGGEPVLVVDEDRRPVG
jgi:osmoprotectant transport system ATP-binding protein